jgi:hypothetical protein
MSVGAIVSNRKIDSLLGDKRRRRSTLTNLLGRSSLRESWTAQLRALLPEELHDQCEVATVQGPVLTVLTPNAAWATRLRFMLPKLLPELNQLADFGGVSDIQIRIAPHLTAASRTMEGYDLPPPNPPNASVLEEFASDLEYGDLQRAILRLARHGRGGTGQTD